MEPDRSATRFPALKGNAMTPVFGVAAFIGALFALIALLPDFQGSKASGWDRQEDDE